MRQPWFLNPRLTCRVLNRIANRFPVYMTKELKVVLDHCMEMLWLKQEHWNELHKI